MTTDSFSIPACAKRKLRELGYTVSDRMSGHISEWWAWYTQDKPFYKVRYLTSRKDFKTRDRYSLRPARKVCREWASLILNEETAISVEDATANAWLQDFLAKSGFWFMGQMTIEKAFAMGTGAWALWFDLDGDDVSKIMVRRYDARMIVPLTWDEDGVTECAFVTRATRRGERYVQLQVHVTDDDTETYHIKTYLFQNGKEVDQEDLGASADFDTRQAHKTFGIVKPGLENVVVDLSPFGISVFYDAIDAIRATDLSWDSIYQEVDLGRLRVFMDEGLMEVDDDDDGHPRAVDTDDMVYRLVAGNGTDDLIKEFAPNLRIEQLKSALNIALSQLGDNCGFGTQYFEIGKTGGLKTATEVVSDNGMLMRSIRKHENSVGDAISDIVTGLLSCSNVMGYDKASFAEDFGPVSIKYDDSIITDTQTEKQLMLNEIAAGVVPAWMYLKTWYGMSDEEAKEAISEGGIADFGL